MLTLLHPINYEGIKMPKILADKELLKCVLSADKTSLETNSLDDISQYSKHPHSYYEEQGLKVLSNWDEVNKLIHVSDVTKYIEPFMEISKEKYYDILGELSHKNYLSGNFFSLEAYTLNIHYCCIEKEGRYFGANKEITKDYLEYTEEIDAAFFVEKPVTIFSEESFVSDLDTQEN